VSLSQDELIHGSRDRPGGAAGPVADVDYRIAQRAALLVRGADRRDLGRRGAGDRGAPRRRQRDGAQTGAPVAGSVREPPLPERSRVDHHEQTISVGRRLGDLQQRCLSPAELRTTSTVARFNNSGTQVTVVVLQNTADNLVAGTLWFWNTAGGLAGSWPFSIAAHGTLTLNAATVVPSTGGTITVSNDGRHGDLSGKAVAVEPATGFTFDTPLVLAEIAQYLSRWNLHARSWLARRQACGRRLQRPGAARWHGRHVPDDSPSGAPARRGLVSIVGDGRDHRLIQEPVLTKLSAGREVLTCTVENATSPAPPRAGRTDAGWSVTYESED
jgi:hypothetical protein